MHWILQDSFPSAAGWSALVAALDRFGIPRSVHAVVPRLGDLVPEPVLGHDNAICIGSYSMRHAARNHGWVPGVFDLFHQDFEQQRAHWGDHLLNASSTVCALEDATFVGERMFVRPVKDSKHFSGRVFTADEFRAFRRSICDPAPTHGTSLAPQTRIQLSRPLEIHAEYRFWVVAGEIVTQSLYRRGDRVMYASEVDQRVARFVEDRIREWAPHEAFVIDACDGEKGLKVVEINTLNASNFYAADVQRLVLALDDRFTR